MTFIQSIKTCFRKYANFKGRAMRSEFWWFHLFIMLTLLALVFSGGFLAGLQGSAGGDELSPVFLVAELAFALPLFAVTSRRLHDIGLSGWLQLPTVLAYLEDLSHVIKGFNEIALVGVITNAAVLYWVVLLLILIKDSQGKTNKYGPNPKSPEMGEIFS